MEPVDEIHQLSLLYTEQNNRKFEELKAAVAKWELPEYVV